MQNLVSGTKALIFSFSLKKIIIIIKKVMIRIEVFAVRFFKL